MSSQTDSRLAIPALSPVIAHVTVPMQELLHPLMQDVEAAADLPGSFSRASASSAKEERHRAQTPTAGRMSVRHSHHPRYPPQQV